MAVDTIKTSIPATLAGEAKLFERLGTLVRHVKDEDVIVLDGADGPVFGIVVQEPEFLSLADRIAAAVKGQRIGST